MPEISPFLSVLISAATGILSGWGIGGGTLLILILILFCGAETDAGQFINLAYFIPSAASSLLFHAKGGRIEKRAVLWAGSFGCISAVLSYYAARWLSGRFLSVIFGALLIYLGIREIFSKSS